MNHPGMTSRGKRITLLFAALVALAIPIKAVCGYPGAKCGRAAPFKMSCKSYELEPLAFYLLEKALDRDVGFAYTSGEDCR
jgi:hypothetical protein